MYDNYELMAAVETASRLYHHSLMKSPSVEANVARSYIASRKLFSPAAEQFRLGYAPKLIGKPFILTKMTNAKLLVEAGLLREGQDGRLYDPLEGRILFPQVNPSGKFLGFVGRRIGDGDSEKYLATGATEIFRRTESLFRIDMARREIEARNSVIIVEGMFDAVLMWQVGIRNVVSTGTKALTAAQSQILQRYTDRLEIMFDNDDEGRKGAEEVRRRRGFEFSSVTIREYPERFNDPGKWVEDRIERAIRNQQAAIA